MNHQEPSKVTLDYHHLEKLFNDRARLFQSQEEIGRPRKEVKNGNAEIRKLQSEIDTNDHCKREPVLPGDVEYEKGRLDAFAEIADGMKRWAKNDTNELLHEIINKIIHSEKK